MRVCWTAPDAPTTDAAAEGRNGSRPDGRPNGGDASVTTARMPRTFVPVEDLDQGAASDRRPTPVRATPVRATPVPPPAVATATAVARWSLWDDPEGTA